MPSPPSTPGPTRDEVVTAAVLLADAGGLGAVSVPALADRLGVGAASLGRHVPTDGVLLDAMVEHVVAGLHDPVTGAPWREELWRRSHAARSVLLRHPWAVGLLGSRATAGPLAAAHREACTACLRGAGLPPRTAEQVLALLDAHVYGSVTEELALAPGEAPSGRDLAKDFEVGLDLVLGALAGPAEPGVAPSADTRAPSTASKPEPVEVLAPVLGVDGCRAGWVGALLVPGAPRPRVVVAPTLAELVETVRAEVALRAVGVDIPIGLPDAGLRQADALARLALRGRASSVFTTLTRDAYAAPTRADADAVNRRLSGQGVAAQAFALRDKILEVDAWVRARPTVEVLEVHPEVSFVEMSGGPLPAGKKSEEGRAARLAALAAAGIPRPSVLSGSGYAADDVLDACAVAWTAARRAAGHSRSLPDPPEVFSDGIPAAIHV